MSITPFITFLLTAVLLGRFIWLVAHSGIQNCGHDPLRFVMIALAHTSQVGGAVGLAMAVIWPLKAPTLQFAAPILIFGTLLSLCLDRRLFCGRSTRCDMEGGKQ